MAENGEEVAMEGVKEEKEEPMEEECEQTSEHSEDYQKLVDYGIDLKVAAELDNIYKSGKTLM